MNENTKRSRGTVVLAASVAALALGLVGSLTGAAAAPGPTDLALTKTDSADPVAKGANLTYTVGVANLGVNDATDVVVTDDLPSQVSYVSSTTTQGTCARQGDKVTCELGTLNAAATATIRITVKASKHGTASNTATVATSVVDGVTANNQDTETTVISKTPGGKKPKPSCATPTIAGTAGNDTLVGTKGADVIRGFSGADRIFALGGKDLVCADRGNDVANGGEKDDTVLGGPGRDRLVGAEGNDLLKGKAGRDRLAGRAGNDFLAGGRGRDKCKGGAGADTLRSCP